MTYKTIAQLSTPPGIPQGSYLMEVEEDGVDNYFYSLNDLKAFFGGDFSVSLKTANFAALNNTIYLVNTTSAAITATLPASPVQGERVGFADYSTNFGTNALTITPGAGHTISGQSSLVLNTNGSSAQLVFMTDRWIPYSLHKPVGNSFGAIAVSGQDTVTANGASSTLSLAAGSNVTITTNAGTDTITISASGGGGGGAGTVTSVGLSMPDIFAVTGSPVTASGTLTAGLSEQTANKVWASPNGAIGAPVFRALVVDDIPPLDASKIGRGTISDARLSANVTAQGNTFNAANKLVQLDVTGKLPAVDGSQLTGLSAGGSNTQIQFNNSGVFGGSGSLTWNGTTLSTNGLSVSGSVSLPDNSLSLSDLPTVTASKLIGRGSSGSGNLQELTVGSGLSLSGTTLTAIGGFNISSFIQITKQPITFTYSSPNDNNGYFRYLGTGEGANASFSNPAPSEVRTWFGSGTSFERFAWTDKSLSTEDSPSTSDGCTLRLEGSRSIQVSGLYIAIGNNSTAINTTFSLDGSNNLSSWTNILSFSVNQAQNFSYTNYYTAAPNTALGYFKYFRIQPAATVSNHSFYEIELYGSIPGTSASYSLTAAEINASPNPCFWINETESFTLSLPNNTGAIAAGKAFFVFRRSASHSVTISSDGGVATFYGGTTIHNQYEMAIVTNFNGGNTWIVAYDTKSIPASGIIGVAEAQALIVGLT